MKRRGFTLIELLAVIVVLAIIALIAVPMVLNTIEEARKGAAKASALTYVSEVEKYIVSSQLDSSKVKLEIGKSYSLNSAGESGIILNDIIDIKGDKPTSGTITIGEDNTVEKATLTINNYELECENQTCEVIGTKEEEPKDEPSDEVISTGTAILDIAKALVYAEDGETCKIDADETDTTTYKYMDGCYIKGASTSNYVWYNGFMWRIMGINSDDTVRLITDENVTALAYGAEDAGLTYTTNEGYIHDWLNNETDGLFYKNLNSTKNIIQEGAYFCSESTDEQTLTEGRTTCAEGNIVTTKVGIISMDEYLLAGSTSSYLNIGQYVWTMTPYNKSNVWHVNYDNNIKSIGVPAAIGIRPVINVSPTSIITAGDGTAQNFFVLGEDKSTDVTGKLSEKVTSGEYVTLEGKTYRVVRKTNDGIKLILDSFYEEEGTIYTMGYGDNNTFTTESGIGAKLNGDVLNWLGVSNDQIVETTYYQGNDFDSGKTYRSALDSINGKEAKVGLIQIGDILSSQSSTMLTNNYNLSGNYSNVKTYWTMSKNSTGNWGIGNDNSCAYGESEKLYAIRPVITVRNDLDIISGTGTWKTPYQI